MERKYPGAVTNDTKDILIAYAEAVAAFKKAFEDSVWKVSEKMLVTGVSIDYKFVNFNKGKLSFAAGITGNFAMFGEGEQQEKTVIGGVYLQGNFNWSRESGAVVRVTALQDVFMAPLDGSALSIYGGVEQRIVKGLALTAGAQAQIAKYADFYKATAGAKYYFFKKLSIEAGYGASLTQLDVGAKFRQLNYTGAVADIISSNIPDKVWQQGPYVETNINLGKKAVLRAGGSYDIKTYGAETRNGVTGFTGIRVKLEDWNIDVGATYQYMPKTW
jgi:hypothetical protein